MSRVSSKTSLSQSTIYCFLFRFSLPSLLLMVIHYLLTSSSSSACHYNPFLYLSTNNVFQKAVAKQDVTNLVNLHLPIVCKTFISSLTLCNTSSFLTRSVQVIFSILLHSSHFKIIQVFLI